MSFGRSISGASRPRVESGDERQSILNLLHEPSPRPSVSEDILPDELPRSNRAWHESSAELIYGLAVGDEPHAPPATFGNVHHFSSEATLHGERSSNAAGLDVCSYRTSNASRRTSNISVQPGSMPPRGGSVEEVRFSLQVEHIPEEDHHASAQAPTDSCPVRSRVPPPATPGTSDESLPGDATTVVAKKYTAPTATNDPVKQAQSSKFARIHPSGAQSALPNRAPLPIGPLPDGTSRGMKSSSSRASHPQRINHPQMNFSSSRARVGVVPPIGKVSHHVDSTAVRSQQEWLSSAVRVQAEKEEAPKYVQSDWLDEAMAKAE